MRETSTALRGCISVFGTIFKVAVSACDPLTTTIGIYMMLLILILIY